jgi:hypothetical protein
MFFDWGYETKREEYRLECPKRNFRGEYLEQWPLRRKQIISLTETAVKVWRDNVGRLGTVQTTTSGLGQYADTF